MEKTPFEPNIVEKLLTSFNDLERAIEGAGRSLSQNEWVTSDVFTRLDTYKAILTKQRAMAEDLRASMNSGDTVEVGRRISIINSLSSMIVDDARAMLSSLTDSDQCDEEAEDAVMMC